jgi:hypothetical protein
MFIAISGDLRKLLLDLSRVYIRRDCLLSEEQRLFSHLKNPLIFEKDPL